MDEQLGSDSCWGNVIASLLWPMSLAGVLLVRMGVPVVKLIFIASAQQVVSAVRLQITNNTLHTNKQQ
jgi:hypothetical protein